MVRYEYDPIIEKYRRVDNKGKPLDINIVEARRIVALKNLGYKVPSIYRDNEMDLPSKIGITTLRTFIKNYEDGNISIEGEFPVPRKVLDDMTRESDLDDLKRRVEVLEELVKNMTCECKTEEKSKVRKWLKL